MKSIYLLMKHSTYCKWMSFHFTMKMRKILPCFGTLYDDEAPHSITHELTLSFVKEADSFSRHDEVHEERTYGGLTYDILLEQAGFSLSNSMRT